MLPFDQQHYILYKVYKRLKFFKGNYFIYKETVVNFQKKKKQFASFMLTLKFQHCNFNGRLAMKKQLYNTHCRLA